jgi:hypothetical protein
VGETVFGRPAAVAGPIDHLHPAHAFPTVGAMRDGATSAIDEESDEILFLVA